MVALNQHLKDSPPIDYELSRNKAPENPFPPFAEADEPHNVNAEGDTRKSCSHYTCRLCREFPFHCLHSMKAIEALPVMAEAPSYGMRNQRGVE